jgi:hypothetical protein
MMTMLQKSLSGVKPNKQLRYSIVEPRIVAETASIGLYLGEGRLS